MKEVNNRLYRAVEMGLSGSVEKCVVDGADVNAEFYGRSLLQYAAESKKNEIIGILIENGANPNASSSSMKSALALSCEFGNYEAILTLLAGGANPNFDRGAPLISSCAIR